MKKNFLFSFLVIAIILIGIFSFRNRGPVQTLPKADADNAGLTLPSGFSAMIVADNTGEARHLV
ncbi:MAG: PQQ-dependent sugar dehydrogenase, partial [Ginsengibacter sp.]